MNHPRAPLALTTRLAIWLAVLVCVAYGLMNTSYLWTQPQHELAWSTRVISALVSDTYFNGSTHAPQWVANYERAMGSIVLHTVVGGLALSLCALQFVPGLRQRSPRTHRLIGWAAVGTCAVSMVSSLAYLRATPLQQGFGGPIFGVGLWLLAVSTLQCLWMGVTRARQRRWREHMGWMTMTSALLMTAPLLRIGDVVVGRLLDTHVDTAGNLLVGGLSTLSFWLCLSWATRAGQRELPLAAATPVLQPVAWLGLAVIGAALLVHEALLAPRGLDLLAWLGTPRSAADLLPRGATAWALVAMAVLPEAARGLGDDTRRQGDLPLARPLAWLAVLLGAVSLWTASPWGAGGWATYDQAALTGTWAFSGASAVGWALAGLTGRLDGRNASRARVMGLTLLMAPSGAALALPLLLWWGLPPLTVLTASLALGLGWMAWYGAAGALGLSLPGAQPARAASTSNALA